MRVILNFNFILTHSPKQPVPLDASEFALIPLVGDIIYDDGGAPHTVISRAFSYGPVTTFVELTCGAPVAPSDTP